MVNRKMGNIPSLSTQPVRFYKIIALTFLTLTILLLGLIVFVSSKTADIIITAKSDNIDASFSFDVGSLDSGVPVNATVTSTVVSASKIFNPKGERHVTGKAAGMVTLYNDSAAAQPLVATTRLLTKDGVLFRMKSGATVPAKGSINVEVYADKEGQSSDIRAADFTIPGLNPARQKEVYGKSDRPISGGVKTVGIIGSDDIKKSSEIVLQELKQAGYDFFSNNFKGRKIATIMAQYAIEPDKKIGDETDSFTLNGRATIVAVAYDEEEINKYAGELLNKQIVDNSELLESASDDPSVSIENYDAASGVATVKAVKSGVVNIDPNSRELQKIMFFGKNEDEMRRYLLSLNHVQAVEMKFKPFWSSTVPHVADRINVIVKQEAGDK